MEERDTYYVYIVRCADGTLYTGTAKDLDARLAKHNQGLGAKYTRGRLPVALVYSEITDSRSEALKRELAIKKMSLTAKQALFRSDPTS